MEAAGVAPGPTLVGDGPRASGRRKQFAVLIVFIVVVAPVVTLILGFIFGAILAAMEGWPWWTGVLYVLSNLTGLGNPLTSAMPVTLPGVVADIILAAWALGILGTVIGCVANVSFTSTVIDAMESVGSREPQGQPSLASQAMAFVSFALVVIPVVLCGIGALFGLMLAAGEGWELSDGVLYVVGNIVTLANPLVSNSPTTVSGEVFDLVVSLWALALSGAALGVVGSFSLPNTLTGAIEEQMLAGKLGALGGQAEANLRAEAGAGGSGLSVEEMFAMLQHEGLVSSEEQCRRLFVLFDADGSGSIDSLEVERLVECLHIVSMGAHAPQHGERAAGGALVPSGRAGADLDAKLDAIMGELAAVRHQLDTPSSACASARAVTPQPSSGAKHAGIADSPMAISEVVKQLEMRRLRERARALGMAPGADGSTGTQAVAPAGQTTPFAPRYVHFGPGAAADRPAMSCSTALGAGVLETYSYLGAVRMRGGVPGAASEGVAAASTPLSSSSLAGSQYAASRIGSHHDACGAVYRQADVREAAPAPGDEPANTTTSRRWEGAARRV